MENKLEILLNKLIDLWWKPRGKETKSDHNNCWWYITSLLYKEKYILNDLCSLDSGLWQFVCWLDKDYLPFCSKCNIKLESNNDKIKWDVWCEEEVNFWIMLSSIQTDKEKFLLSNINIPDGETK
jgi:hypothetical protein